ncbi:MAG: ArsB/NhaD family transporter [Rhodospirillales bacterium]|nr:ArsB/NhaD family transporter [Rhodospirillales bacterium]
MLIAVGVLVATYAGVMSEKINRSIVALLGALLMIILGILSQEEAIKGIDFNTIGLLVGMMIIVSITRKSGVFEYMAIWTAKLVNASPAGILAMLAIVTAVVSALLDNVTTVLLVVPVTLVITEQLKVKPYPFLFSQILASNIGGTATLIGDPPNILIGTQVGLTFNQFVVNLAPVILLILAVHVISMHLIWGRSMQATAEARARVMAFDEKKAITDHQLLKQSLGVLALVIAAFVTSRFIGLEAGAIGMAGAAILMLLDNLGKSSEHQTENVTKVFGEVEWITIFFFLGLFMVIAGVEHTGALELLAHKLIEVTGGDLEVTGLGVMWASAVLSAIVDNIPFVATMIPLIKAMAPTFGGPDGLVPLWWALSLGACLGGNGTLIGASANLTVAGIAERNGIPFRFVTFTKIAFPLMIIHVAICNAYLLWRFL